MPLIIFEDAMQEVRTHLEEWDFSDILRYCREAIGVKQYRAAEFMEITQFRLKNLETSNFKHMPTKIELMSIAYLYDIRYNLLVKKAKEQLTNISPRRTYIMEKDRLAQKCC